MSSAAAPVSLLAMLDALSPPALREIERLLNARLYVEITPAEERGDKLALLMRLQQTHGRRPDRIVYDEIRPPGSTSSRRLVDIYGSWTKACRAAATEQDLRAAPLPPHYLKPLRPWANPSRDERRPPSYTVEEIIRAVIACAGEIGRIPTSNAYYDWAAQKRRRARQLGAPPPRIPTQRSVERHFSSWDEVWVAVKKRLSSNQEHDDG